MTKHIKRIAAATMLMAIVTTTVPICDITTAKAEHTDITTYDNVKSDINSNNLSPNTIVKTPTCEDTTYEQIIKKLKDINAIETIDIETKPETKPEKKTTVLTPRKGVNQGPTGKETWYNMDMTGVLYLMNHLGYTYEEYPYWIREDGVKMFGDYVMAAADLSIFPKGTIVESSLGTAMIVDTGDLEPYQLDIAVNWE